jgi:hypothetical protein
MAQRQTAEQRTNSFPGVKTPGDHRPSLREEQHLSFAAERHIMVTRPFKAGISTPTIDCVAERQLMRARRHPPSLKPLRLRAFACQNHPPIYARSSVLHREIIHASLRDAVFVASFPGVETPDYHRPSLREEQHLSFAAERHLMVTRPFKAGITTPTIDCVAERQLMRARRHSPSLKPLRLRAFACQNHSPRPSF